MTYTHLTTNELVLIESYFNIEEPVTLVARRLNRSRQTIYKVFSFLKQRKNALDYYRQYKQNKSRCGRPSTILSDEQSAYVQKKVAQRWTPDVIIGRGEFPIDCSARTLYRMFKKGVFDTQSLPMKGKRKPNGHQEKRGEQAFRRTIHERNSLYPHLSNEFGHLEGDTIVGVKHKSAVITLVECLSKVIITLKPTGRRSEDIENRLNDRFKSIPKHLFKLMTFDCGKEFSNWRSISKSNDIAILGTPSQRWLNEHSNGLIRRESRFQENH